MINRRALVLGLPFASPLKDAFAQNFPVKSLSILVPYSPGGPTDLMARSVAEVMTERLRQPVIVDNRPGAGGQIAGTALVRAPADGHTLMLGDIGTLAVNAAIVAKSAWEPAKDVQGIAPLLQMPMLLLIRKDSPYNSLAELVAASKKSGISFASQGPGSGGHILGEMLSASSVGKFVHVPYKGSAPAMNDLLGGMVDMLFDGVPAALQHLRTNKLKCLAVAGPNRVPLLPDVPTTAELGYKDVSFPIWFGVVARGRTPEPIAKLLNQEVAYAMGTQKVKNRFIDLGFQPMSMSSEQFTQFVRAEAGRWSAFARARNIRAD